MYSRRIALTNLVIMMVTVSCCLLSTHTAYSAPVFNSSNFMDLQASAEELSLKVEKASPSIVMIVVYENTGAEKGRVSGFFIDREGRIMTNALVLKDAYSAEVFSESNYYDDVTILSRDEDLDLALIQVKATDESPLELDFEYKIRQGERVIAVGKSHDLKKTVSEGIISAVSNIGEELELIQIQTATSILSFPASNDGPLFNMAGKVIGVTTAAISEDQNFDSIPWIYRGHDLNAVSVSSIESFLLRPGKIVHLLPPKSKVWFPWFIKWLKTTAIVGLITLYQIGFPKIVAIIFVVIIFISLIQWLYSRVKSIL